MLDTYYLKDSFSYSQIYMHKPQLIFEKSRLKVDTKQLFESSLRGKTDLNFFKYENGKQSMLPECKVKYIEPVTAGADLTESLYILYVRVE